MLADAIAKQARLSERAWQGQAVEARGVAPALADAAGRSSSIGPAIAFHSKCTRGREPELSGSGASAMSQTFLARICKPPTPALKRNPDFGESGLLENEPTAPAEQAHTTQRQ